MTLRTLLAFTVFFAFSGVAKAAWVHEKTEGTILHFVETESKKTARLKTGTKALQFHTVLTNATNGQAYALYSGIPCEKCGPEQTTVFMHRIDGSGSPFQFVYPGEIRDPKKGIVYQSRAFYGYCVPKVKSAYVAHQGEHVDRRRGFQKSVLIAEPGPEKVEDKLLERRLPSLKTTLQLVKQKQCFEIPGKKRSVLKKTVGAGTPVPDTEDDEDDEDQAEEKKTETPATLEPEASDDAGEDAAPSGT